VSGDSPRHRSGWTLWADGRFVVTTPAVPHLPPEEGCHVLVQPQSPPPHAWADPPLTGAAFEMAARVCRVMEDLDLAPWFNLQANGNWGLLPGNTPHFHIHIYGRRRGSTWGQPVRLPLAPGTFAYPPLPDEDRARLAAALRSELADRYGRREDPYATSGLEAPPPRDA
jgi:diadenosine tetraphosphate (Ap4A) HIT family hydrolase